MTDLNARCITPDTTRYELEVFECVECGYHFGIDGSYLTQVGSVSHICPSCGTEHNLQGEDRDDTPGSPDTPDPTTPQRRARAQAVLDAYRRSKPPQEYVGEPDSLVMRDFVADLLHWCNANRVDFDYELAYARGHAEAESRGID